MERINILYSEWVWNDWDECGSGKEIPNFSPFFVHGPQTSAFDSTELHAIYSSCFVCWTHKQHQQRKKQQPSHFGLLYVLNIDWIASHVPFLSLNLYLLLRLSTCALWVCVLVLLSTLEIFALALECVQFLMPNDWKRALFQSPGKRFYELFRVIESEIITITNLASRSPRCVHFQDFLN